MMQKLSSDNEYCVYSEVADSFAAVRWLQMKIVALGLKTTYYYRISFIYELNMFTVNFIKFSMTLPNDYIFKIYYSYCKIKGTARWYIKHIHHCP